MPFKKNDKNINRKGRLDGGMSITAMVKRKLNQQIVDKNGKTDGTTYADEIIEKIFNKATKDGDVHMLKMIWNYIDGLPKQDIGLTGANNKPIPFLNLNINAIQPNNRNKQNNRVKQENTSSSGGNIGKQNCIDIDVSNRVGKDGQEADTNKRDKRVNTTSEKGSD